MARSWPNWKKRKEPHDIWYYQNEEPDYHWIKQIIVSVLVFAVVYGVHITGTTIGQKVDTAVGYVLSTGTDFAYVAEQLSKYTNKNIDMSVLKKVKTTMSRTADPLMYMRKPVEGKLSSQFGWYTHPVLKQEMMHEGIDIEAPLGTNVQAAAPGTVKVVAESAQHGKTLIIEHGQEINTVYGHLSEVLVKPEEIVSQGQVIARVGKSGMTNVPMLYFEIREKGKAIDPLSRIKGEFLRKEGK